MNKPKTNPKWVNAKIEDPELLEQLDEMVSQDESDRSKFIRRLIREEHIRRNSHMVGRDRRSNHQTTQS